MRHSKCHKYVREIEKQNFNGIMDKVRMGLANKLIRYNITTNLALDAYNAF